MHDVLIGAVGEFGTAVAQRLAADYEVRTLHPVELREPSRWPAARIQVVAAWRETPALFDLADRVAFLLRRPWIPITLDATSLRVGPLVTGDRGPCYQCYRGRQYQHGRWRELDRELFAVYDREPDCGVGGFLPAHLTLAVQAAAVGIDAVLAGDADAERGRLRRFGLLTPRAAHDRLIPVDSCPRCGRRRPDDTWTDLQSDLAGLIGRDRRVGDERVMAR